METPREAMLEAFARLFTKTADKLQVPYTDEELAEAGEQFAERLGRVLDVVATLPIEPMPAGSLETLEKAIDELSPAEVVGQMAALPLIQHTQDLLQQVARRAVERKFIEEALEEADDTYGGN
jgi:hypothetical protein